MKAVLIFFGALVIASTISLASSANVHASGSTQDVANCTTAVKTGNGWQVCVPIATPALRTQNHSALAVFGAIRFGRRR